MKIKQTERKTDKLIDTQGKEERKTNKLIDTQGKEERKTERGK